MPLPQRDYVLDGDATAWKCFPHFHWPFVWGATGRLPSQSANKSELCKPMELPMIRSMVALRWLWRGMQNIFLFLTAGTQLITGGRGLLYLYIYTGSHLYNWGSQLFIWGPHIIICGPLLIVCLPLLFIGLSGSTQLFTWGPHLNNWDPTYYLWDPIIHLGSPT